MAKRRIVKDGERFGKLTVVKEAPRRPTGRHRMLYVRCDCGSKQFIVRSIDLTRKSDPIERCPSYRANQGVATRQKRYGQ
jgi:hypothetical protein